ncbi:MAG: hypothetical protein HY352_02000 [Candidatus Omnitrophica bacterium]|nr:hypothetical protein [Candidatus Omnitrophota bacterium]
MTPRRTAGRSARRTLPSWALLLPVAAFILINLVFYLAWPIIAGDTDLWYHLTAGRYIAQHHAIPHESFFSFLQPPRQYIDYYWFFQVLVYHLHAWWGYPGLLGLRALLYIVTLLIVARMLSTRQSSLSARLYSVAVFMVVAVILQYRFMIVRPHMVSYLCVAAFILILEYYPRWAIYLPLLGLLWMNAHGIVYPVMGLICMAYLIEYVVRRATATLPAAWSARSFLLPLFLCLATVYATPFGARLPNEALIPTDHAAQYIVELTPYSLTQLGTFQFPALLPTQDTLVNLVFLVAFGSALAAAVRGRLRISHAILLLGGAAIMFKHGRFANEFVLLALPILTTHPLVPDEASRPASSPLLVSMLLVLLLAVPLFITRQLFGDRGRYPLSSQKLPTGVVTFLRTVNTGGSILNHPNAGGYFEWMLLPRYRIYADLQAPFLFGDEDIFTAIQTFKNGEVLRKVVAAYHPAFITVPAGQTQFPTLIEPMPQYQKVFFDDEEVLYVDRAQHPEIAARYGLSALDPFQITENDIPGYVNAAIRDGKKDGMRGELTRMLDVAPDVRMLNELAGALDKIDGAFAQALPHAQRIIEAYPEFPEGYASKADALREMGRPAEALVFYRKALVRANPAIQRKIYRAMGWTYRLLEQPEAAYQAFARSVKPFASEEIAYDDLYWLGSTALLTGRIREGMTLYRLAKRIAPPDSASWQEWNAKMQQALSPSERAKEAEDPVLRQAQSR